MEIAIYGGSFNPPHVGHAMVASWLLWTGRVDQVWLVPCFEHAFSKELAPFDTRVAMCRATGAAIDASKVQVTEIERDLPTPSYTIHTLRALAERHPGRRFRLVVGSDNLSETHRWHDWAAIEAGFDPIWVGRSGYPEVPDAPTFPGVSSTEIRRLRAAGRPVDHLMTRGARALLGDLYRHV